MRTSDNNKRIILYLSTMCSDTYYDSFFYKTKPNQQMQKFNMLISEGIAYYNDICFNAISSRPITSRNCDYIFIKKEKEMFNNVNFIYLPILNTKILKPFSIIFSSIFYIFPYVRKNNVTIICDPLNLSILIASLIIKFFFRTNCIAIVTDVPGFYSKNEKSMSAISNLWYKTHQRMIKSFDAFVFLTDYMNDLLNRNNKPYCIIEGLTNFKMKYHENSIIKKNKNKKICLYAGSISESNGIDVFIKAFIIANLKDAELHIYGDGHYKRQAIEYSKKFKTIKVFDPISNYLIIDKEIEADVLINPRLTNKLFTKYSFPSKILEYLSSGTPVLTTRLSSISEDYYDYMYFFQDDSINGMATTLKEILSKSKLELNKFGLKAKEWSLQNKSNILQARKIIALTNCIKPI